MRAFFQQKGYTAEEPDFHSFEPQEQTVFFIDGGNALISDNGITTQQQIRTAVVCFKGKRRTIVQQREGICETTLQIVENKEQYHSTLSEWDISCNIDAHNKRLSVAERIIENQKIGETMRRFAELQEAITLTQQQQHVIIVLDGTLECTHPDEEKWLDTLYTTAKQHNNTIVGFNKTNRAITEEGELFVKHLDEHGIEGRWYAYPIATTQTSMYQAEMCFVKLYPMQNNQKKHPSQYIFRLDIVGEKEEAIAGLAMSANDFTFPGYPYGLMLADKLARVSNEQKRMHKERRALQDDGQGSLSPIDIHGILDTFS